MSLTDASASTWIGKPSPLTSILKTLVLTETALQSLAVRFEIWPVIVSVVEKHSDAY